MSVIVGNAALIWLVLLDSENIPITTASDDDFTESIDHESTTGTLSSATVGPWSHRASGRYSAIISNALAGRYIGTITYAGPPVQVFAWECEVITAQQADPVAAVGLTSARVAKLDRIGSGTAVATSPVGEDATTLRIDRGDDYTGDNPIPFSEPSTGWPDLTDAQSVALLLLNRVNVVVLTVAGSVVNATPGAQTIAFELTESQTGALNLGPHAYQFRVKAVLANGADRTLALGEVEVRA